MIKKIFFSLLFLLLSVSPRAQNRYPEFGGTFIMGIVTKGGIVLAADSRTSWFDRANTTVIAYNDKAKKIYHYKTIAFAMSGLNAFFKSKLTFTGLFDTFAANNKTSVTSRTFLQVFFKFAKANLSAEEYIKLTYNDFIIAGYELGAPRLVHYADCRQQEVAMDHFASNDPSVNSGITYDNLNNFIKGRTIGELVAFANRAVTNIIEHNNKAGISIVGGHPSIVTVTERAIKWNANDFSDNYKTVGGYIKAVLSNQIKVRYRSKSDSVQLRDRLLPFSE